MRKSHTYYVTRGVGLVLRLEKYWSLRVFMSSGIANVIQEHAAATIAVTSTVCVHKRKRLLYILAANVFMYVDFRVLLSFHRHYNPFYNLPGRRTELLFLV